MIAAESETRTEVLLKDQQWLS